MNDISRIAKVIAHIRRHVNKDLPCQHLAIFLAVAENPGITMPELIRQLDMPQGTLSRNVKLLSRFLVHENGASQVKGHDLLKTEPVTTGRHALAVDLTEKGRLLMNEIRDIMQDEKQSIRRDPGSENRKAALG